MVAPRLESLRIDARQLLGLSNKGFEVVFGELTSRVKRPPFGVISTFRTEVAPFV